MRFPTFLAAGILSTLLAGCHDATSSPAEPSTLSPPSAPGMTTEGYPTRGPSGTGWIFGRSGQPVAVTYEVQHGQAVIGGDIIIGSAATIPSTRETLVGLRDGAARRALMIDAAARRWPGGVVPYTIAADVPNTHRLTNAMDYLHSLIPAIQFVPRTSQSDYVSIRRSDGCASSVGRSGGAQALDFADGCSAGSAMHELLHAVGLQHEHDRCDRDQYVTIYWNNIDPDHRYNFDIICFDNTPMAGYDEGSIMHYAPTDFGVNGAATIVSNRGLDYLMGQRVRPSDQDIQAVNYMYPPPPFLVDAYPYREWMMTEPGGYTWTGRGYGGDGNYTFHWSVLWPGQSEFVDYGTGPTLTLYFNCPQYYDQITVRVVATDGRGFSTSPWDNPFAVDTRQSASCQ